MLWKDKDKLLKKKKSLKIKESFRGSGNALYLDGGFTAIENYATVKTH